jgi:hypothetical protein
MAALESCYLYNDQRGEKSQSTLDSNSSSAYDCFILVWLRIHGLSMLHTNSV